MIVSPTPDLSILGRGRLLVRIWLAAVRIQLDLRRRTLPVIAAEIADASGDATTSANRHPPALLSRAVSRGLRVGPVMPRCLVRSLVLYRLLRDQGESADLVIGLKDRPTSKDAHAWVELDGRDLGPLPGRQGYRELTRYPLLPPGATEPGT